MAYGRLKQAGLARNHATDCRVTFVHSVSSVRHTLLTAVIVTYYKQEIGELTCIIRLYITDDNWWLINKDKINNDDRDKTKQNRTK